MKIIYAVFDRKTCSTSLVKEASSIEEFERWFATVFLRSESMFALYPADFDIYHLCAFDDQHMKINTGFEPELLCSVDELFDIFKIPRPTLAQSGE